MLRLHFRGQKIAPKSSALATERHKEALLPVHQSRTLLYEDVMTEQATFCLSGLLMGLFHSIFRSLSCLHKAPLRSCVLCHADLSFDTYCFVRLP